MKVLNYMVGDILSAESCDVIKKQLMMLEGIIDVAIDVDSKIVHVKINDLWVCSKDIFMCYLRDLGYSVNPIIP